MNLRQLKYFLAVAEERRFNSAARRLHIAAPSLSQQIRALERDLGVALFDRTAQGAELTSAGRLLAQRARIILAEVDRAREDVQSDGPDQTPISLRVCTMADVVLDGPLRTIDIPNVEVFVTPSPGDDAIEAVRQGRADGAVVWRRSEEDRDLDGAVLGLVAFGIALHRSHPLAGWTSIPVTRLREERVVMFPRAPFSGIWQRTLDHLLPDGASPGQVDVEPDLINSPEAMLRDVAARSGVAPAILGLAEHMGVRDIVVRPLDPPLLLVLEVVWRRPVRPAFRRLVDYLVEAVDEPQVLVTKPRSAAQVRGLP